ncbi:ABC transporter substrate-binding protein [Streptomyces sp. NPDC004610]|uniref:ABC transporter substrate-binding protein n=1 Tax=unclassified Streptomyces TaxID=2593676 RepID=UPI0033ABC19A
MRSMTRACAAGLAISIVALAGCSDSGADAESADGLTPVRVSVGAIAGSSTPMYMAVDNGTFEDLGLDVTIETATSGSLAVPTILADQFQFAMTGFDSYISAQSEGLPVTMVSAVNRLRSADSGYDGLIVPTSSTATDLGDVSILATPDSARTALMDLRVTGMGGDYEAMQLLQVPLGSIGDTVASGAADAGYLFQPFLGQALEGGDVKLLESGSAEDLTVAGAPSAVLIASEEYLGDHEDTAERFAQGVLEAYAYAAAHPDEVSEASVGTGLVDEPVPADNLPDYAAEAMPVAVVQRLLDVYSELGYLPEETTANDIVWLPGGNFAE